MTNTGLTDLTQVIFSDPLPECTDFIADSLYIEGTQQVGAIPPFGIDLGTIIVGDSRAITFQAETTCIPSSFEWANQSAAAFEYQLEGITYFGTSSSNHALTQA